jgi:DHA2 family multidrug resistance protein
VNATAAEGASHVKHRNVLTVCVMLATIMQALDMTIANVALRHIQGSLAASSDEILWVLTSYTLASAIMTPPTGFLTERIGRKRFFIMTVVGFTFASALCGMATSMNQIVLFRVLQGAFGAPLIPLSQMVLLDSYPREKHGQAMALWGQGVMVGPILGPTLGGYFTDVYNWRWVFFINLPFGIVTVLGLLFSMHSSPARKDQRFDWMGFVLLSVALSALQLMLDRGQIKDWFGSTEITTEACVAALAFYLFFVHIFTADKPFISPKLFLDRNLSSGLVFIFIFGVVLLASMALMPTFIQDLLDYPVFTTGLVLAPRGVGSMLAMLVVGRIIGKVDSRPIIAFGVLALALSFWQTYHFTLDIGIRELVETGIIQGVGTGCMFVPLSTITFSTIGAAERPAAASMFSLMRNVGSAIGVSIVQFLLIRNIQINHAQMTDKITPYNPLLGFLPHGLSPSNLHGASVLDMEVTRQATAIGYYDDFKLMAGLTCLMLPLLLIFRKPRQAPQGEAHAVLE